MPSSAKKDRIISLFPPHVGNYSKYIIAHVPLNKALQYSVFINKLSFGRCLEINLRKITEIAQNIYVGHCFIMTLLQFNHCSILRHIQHSFLNSEWIQVDLPSREQM